MARVLISKAQADLTNYGLDISPGMDAGSLQSLRRTLQLLNTKPFQRNNSQATQSDLSDFGVPRQEIAARQPMPTAEDIERVVRESDYALTPREFVNKVPLIDRKEKGSKERGGEAGRSFGSQMGLEGSLAHGVAAQNFPQILDAEDPLSVPFIRDYYSRQTTIPEHIWEYHTQGPYYDEQGNILPGQVPPVNAVKVMGRDDIASLGTREGYGLKPVPFSKVNMNWEEDMDAKHRFPSQNVGFVGNLSQRDIELNSAGNAPGGGHRDSGVVGIRGFGRPQDKAFARGRVGEGIEGGFTAPIPPERLVGVMPSTRVSRDDMLHRGALQDLYTKDIPFEQKLQQLVSEGEVSPMDAIHALIRHKTIQNQRMTQFGRAQEAATKAALGKPYLRGYYPTSEDYLQGSDAGDTLLQTQISDRGTSYKRNISSPGREAEEKTDRVFSDALPLSWQEGVFGFENPLLTEEEKKQYLQDIVERGHPDEEDIDEMEPEELRSLYPRRAKVRFQ
jgi:hypothetical protein